MHLSWMPKRFAFSWQLVGTCVPVAAGLVWAVKHHLRSDDIVVCFHGDAATANGQWHEGLNIAAVQKLPLLLVCEDNGLAGNVRAEQYIPVKTISERAKGYGIPSAHTDGNDVELVQRMAELAAMHIRRFGGPYLLVCQTTRLGRHKQGQGDLRTKDELARLAERDPLPWIPISPERRRELQARVDEAIESALK